MQVAMTDQKREAIRRAIKHQTTTNTASPEAARAALVRMGIYTKEGEVAAEYREPHGSSSRRVPGNLPRHSWFDPP